MSMKLYALFGSINVLTENHVVDEIHESLLQAIGENEAKYLQVSKEIQSLLTVTPDDALLQKAMEVQLHVMLGDVIVRREILKMELSLVIQMSVERIKRGS